MTPNYEVIKRERRKRKKPPTPSISKLDFIGCIRIEDVNKEKGSAFAKFSVFSQINHLQSVYSSLDLRFPVHLRVPCHSLCPLGVFDPFLSTNIIILELKHFPGSTSLCPSPRPRDSPLHYRILKLQ